MESFYINTAISGFFSFSKLIGNLGNSKGVLFASTDWSSSCLVSSWSVRYKVQPPVISWALGRENAHCSEGWTALDDHSAPMRLLDTHTTPNSSLLSQRPVLVKWSAHLSVLLIFSSFHVCFLCGTFVLSGRKIPTLSPEIFFYYPYTEIFCYPE